jgi:leader peptidase (prepilin peptidase)/N-methyltransferase
MGLNIPVHGGCGTGCGGWRHHSRSERVDFVEGGVEVLELYIVLIGLAAASFIGSLAYRVPRGISMITPSSFCPSCGRRLKAYELVPVVSYLVFRGKCRTCGRSIPIQLLIVEILTPLFYLFLYRRHGMTPLFFSFAYLISLFLYLSLVDLDTGTVSAVDIGALYAGGLATVFLSLRGLTAHSPREAIYGYGLCLGLLGVSVLIITLAGKRKSIGLGDLLILPATALYVGLYGVIRVLLFSSVIGLLAGASLVLLKKVDRDFRFPMLPFVAAGVGVEISLFYNNIVVWGL